MFSQVRTLARGSAEAQYCELDVVPGDLNRYTLTGCLPQRSEPLPLAFAIQDGASYAGAILKAELTQAGITYSGTLLRQTLANDPGTVLATTQSAPLHDLLRIMLKKSDNMIADTVFRTIGHARFGVPGHLAGRFRCRTPDPASTGWGRSRQHDHRRRLWLVAPQPDRPGDHDAGRCSISPSTIPSSTSSPCCRWRATTGRCNTAPVSTRRAWMAKSRRRQVRCRGFITLQALSLPPADKRWPSCNISPATPWNPPTSVIAASRWSALKAACIKICTRTTKTKGPHQMRPFLIQRSQD